MKVFCTHTLRKQWRLEKHNNTVQLNLQTSRQQVNSARTSLIQQWPSRLMSSAGQQEEKSPLESLLKTWPTWRNSASRSLPSQKSPHVERQPPTQVNRRVCTHLACATPLGYPLLCVTLLQAFDPNGTFGPPHKVLRRRDLTCRGDYNLVQQ